MGLFRKKEVRETPQNTEVIIDENVISDPLLRALLDKSQVTKDTVMNIPSVSACINKIGDTVATVKIKLYKRI